VVQPVVGAKTPGHTGQEAQHLLILHRRGVPFLLPIQGQHLHGEHLLQPQRHPAATIAAVICWWVCFAKEGMSREQLGVVIQYARPTAVTLPHTNRLLLTTAAAGMPAAVGSCVQPQEPGGTLLPKGYRPWKQTIWLACLLWRRAAGAGDGGQGVGAAAAAALAGAHEREGRPQPLTPAGGASKCSAMS
jgi:hypothetical protein